jgi:sugar phosphate isomerase/epimerase
VVDHRATTPTCDDLSAPEPLANDAKSPPLSRLAINQITTHRWSFADDLLHYRAEGFEAAGLWRAKVVEFGEERAIELVRDLGMAVSSLAWAGGFTGSDGASFFDAVDDARRAVRLAGRLGAECLVLVSGARTGHIGSHARRLVADAIKALAETAADEQVTLALQPMPPGFQRGWSFVHSIDDALELLDRSRTGAKIAFDVHHLRNEPRLVERIPEIVSQIAVVQLSDGTETSRSELDRCLFGDGHIPLAAITRAFDEAGYAGYYEACLWSEELWRSDYVELLRECRARFDVICRRSVSQPAGRE